jgi:pre-mRNA-splicing factor CWC22
MDATSQFANFDSPRHGYGNFNMKVDDRLSVSSSTALQAEFAKLLNTRSGEPRKRRRLWIKQVLSINDFPGTPYASITGIVNWVNITNIKQIVPELFSENLIRGRGLFTRSIMKAQAASLPFTHVFLVF